MKLKTLFALLAGAAGFFLAAAAVWLYLAVRVVQEGGNQPEIVPDRVAAILFSLAIGSALATAGFTYVSLRRRERRPLAGIIPFFVMMVIPFTASFALLFIAYSQLHSMQFTDRGEPVSLWGYLLICGLPVVVGLVVGVKLEGWFPAPKEQNEKDGPA
jgi:hypothetical protein